MQWQKNMQLIDANVILRYMLNDNKEMSAMAKSLIASGNAYTKPEVISEVIYVLMGVYKIGKSDVRNFVYSLLDDISCNDTSCILLAMDLFADFSLDFVDCLLIAYHKINHENIFSFDKKLNKHLTSH